MSQLTPINQAITMSSLEIAEITGKQHYDVLKDIRRILAEVEIDDGIFSGIYKDSNNRDKPCYNLPRRECDLVVAGYSAKYRLAIIDRWLELEKQQIKTPRTFAEALRLAADIQEKLEETERQRDIAIRTKAEIGSRREATAMNTASQAVKRANKLEIELDLSLEYCTVKRMQMLCHGQKFNWRLLKDAGIALGIDAIDVPDVNYGKVKAYHADVWMEAYAIDLGAVAWSMK